MRQNWSRRWYGCFSWQSLDEYLIYGNNDTPTQKAYHSINNGWNDTPQIETFNGRDQLRETESELELEL